MADVANKRLNIYLDSQAAEVQYKKLQAEQDKLTQKINAGTAAGKSMTTELLKLDKVNAQIKTVQNQLDKGLAPSIKQQTALVAQLSNELKNLSSSDPQFAAKVETFKKQNAELQKMKANVSGVTEVTKDFGSKLTSVFTRVAEYTAAFFAFEKIKQFLSDSIKEADEAEAANARLRNILENIGRLDVFDRLQKKAQDLAKEFKFLDNDDLVEAEQKLITYGKLTESQINDLLPVIINFASKSRISLDESSSVIIKALEGNAKALKEYGINIKEGNDVTERMSILMKDLAPRVDGAAKAFGETLAGSAAIAKQELADLEEEVGNKLTPVLTGFYKTISMAIEGFGIIVDTVKNNVKTNIEYLSVAYNVAKNILTLNPTKAAATIAVFNVKKDAEAQAAQDKLDAANIIAQAESIVQDASKKTFEEQQKIIEQNIVLRNASQAAYEQAIKEDGKLTDRVKQAGQRLTLDMEVVKRLQASLATQKDKTVLGFGGDDVKKTDNSKEEARLKKLNDDYERMFAEFIDHINKLTKDEFDYAFNKILEDAKKKAAEIEKEFGKGSERSNTLLNLLGRSSFGDLQKLVSQQRPGTNTAAKPIELPVRLNYLDNSDLEASTKAFQARLKSVGEETGSQFGQGFQQGLSDFINSDDFKAGVQNLQGLVDIASSFAQAKDNAENAQFAKEQKLNDKKRLAYKRLLDSKLISSNEYNARVKALDDAEDKKKAALEKAQFERNKKIQLAQAIINGALGVTNALATVQPFYAAIIAAALVGVKTVAEIGIINSQKPAFAKGGKLNGPSHSAGGMPVINPVTGRTEAEVEGGEYILSKNTVRNNRSLADALLYSSMYGNGASIQPGYRTRQYTPVDYGGITSTYTRLRYANGGEFVKPTATGNEQSQQGVQSNDRLNAVLEGVLFRLNNPLPSPTSVSLRQIDEATSTRNRIKSEVNFKQS